MRSAITYTALTLFSLIAFLIGIILLPAEVPIHFGDGMKADLFGSPWILIAFPAAAALLSAAVWGVCAPYKMKNRGVYLVLIAVVGAVLEVIGWCFFALASSGTKEGESAPFPIFLICVLTLSLLVMIVGSGLSQLEGKSRLSAKGELFKRFRRLGGALMFFSGLLSAVVTVMLSCLAAEFAYVSAIVFVTALLLSGIMFAIYVFCLSRRSSPEE